MGTCHLDRTAQCAKCPWKVTTDPHTIPDGYTEAAHRALDRTVADPDDTASQVAALHQPIAVMACHESPVGDEQPCVGWLVNQLGPGNNIAVRLWMATCDNAHRLRTHGPQHATFQDTLPPSP